MRSFKNKSFNDTFPEDKMLRAWQGELVTGLFLMWISGHNLLIQSNKHKYIYIFYIYIQIDILDTDIFGYK